MIIARDPHNFMSSLHTYLCSVHFFSCFVLVFAQCDTLEWMMHLLFSSVADLSSWITVIQHHCFRDNHAVGRRAKRGGSVQGECQRRRHRRAMQGRDEEDEGERRGSRQTERGVGAVTEEDVAEKDAS